MLPEIAALIPLAWRKFLPYCLRILDLGSMADPYEGNGANNGVIGKRRGVLEGSTMRHGGEPGQRGMPKEDQMIQPADPLDGKCDSPITWGGEGGGGYVPRREGQGSWRLAGKRQAGGWRRPDWTCQSGLGPG